MWVWALGSNIGLVGFRGWWWDKTCEGVVGENVLVGACGGVRAVGVWVGDDMCWVLGWVGNKS